MSRFGYGPVVAAGAGTSVPPAAWSDASTAVVWQPGGTSVRNIFASLTEAENAIQQVRGPKRVLIDNSIAATPDIDQDFDFGSGQRGEFVGNCGSASGAFNIPVTIADGVQISNCKGFKDGLAVTYVNTAGALSPIRDLVDGQIFQIDQNVSLARSGGGSGYFFDLTNLNGGGFGVIQCGLACALGTAGSGNEAVLVPSGSNLIYIGSERSNLLEDAIDAAVGSTVANQRSSTSALIDERQASMLVTPDRAELALLHGRDYVFTQSGPEQATTIQDPSFDVALTVVLPADLHGTYSARWWAGVGVDNLAILARYQLYNLTDASIVGATRIVDAAGTSGRMTESCGGEIVFTGAAKTLQLRWNTSNSSFAARIQDMTVDFKRVG